MKAAATEYERDVLLERGLSCVDDQSYVISNSCRHSAFSLTRLDPAYTHTCAWSRLLWRVLACRQWTRQLLWSVRSSILCVCPLLFNWGLWVVARVHGDSHA